MNWHDDGDGRENGRDVVAVDGAAEGVNDDMKCPHCRPSWQALV